jgi:hypothetical protein
VGASAAVGLRTAGCVCVNDTLLVRPASGYHPPGRVSTPTLPKRSLKDHRGDWWAQGMPAHQPMRDMHMHETLLQNPLLLRLDLLLL